MVCFTWILVIHFFCLFTQQKVKLSIYFHIFVAHSSHKEIQSKNWRQKCLTSFPGVILIPHRDSTSLWCCFFLCLEVNKIKISTSLVRVDVDYIQTIDCEKFWFFNAACLGFEWLDNGLLQIWCLVARSAWSPSVWESSSSDLHQAHRWEQSLFLLWLLT